MKKTRTVLVTAPHFPPYGGGLERYCYEISTRLNKNHDWKVVVVTSNELGEKNQTEEIDGVKVYRLKTDFKLSNTPFSLRWFLSVRKILKSEKPDVINIHMPVAGIGDVVMILAGSTPIVLTYHSGSMMKDNLLSSIPVWLYETFWLPIVFHRANRIVCSSDFLRNGFIKKYKNKSLTLTPAVDNNLFKPDISRRNAEPTIVFVAGLAKAEQYKGLKTLIESISDLKNKFPNIKLNVVGDGDMRSYYEKKTKDIGLEKNIIFKGRLHGQDLIEEYQKAHLFVLPSSNESFSMVVLEAMSCGLPVISTNVGGIPELISDGICGYMVEPHDSQELTKRIENIIKDHDTINTLGNNSREKIINKYDWDLRVKGYNNTFTELANINIIQIAPYYPPHIGGLERVAQMCAEALPDRGYNVQVITTTQSGRKTGVEKIKKNLEVKTLWSFDFAHTPFAPTLILHLFKIPKNSIIHLHLSQAYFPEFVMLISKIRKIPYVVHFHLDVDASGIFGPIFLFYKKLLWGPLMRNSSKIIACGSDQLEIIPRKFNVPKEKIVLILNAVSKDFFKNRIYSKPIDKLKILYIGRLSSQKKVERIINIASMLKIPFHLTVVGDGEDEQKLKSLAHVLNLKNISFEGKKNDIEMQKYHSENDLFLISSDREGMPLVVLEAMAGGLPIIGTDVMGLHDLLIETGVLVKEPFIENFVKEISSLWVNKEKLVELSEKSVKKAEEFGWSRFIDQLVNVYKNI